MKPRTWILLAVLIALSNALYGQSVSGNIEGWLTNEKNEPIASANIVVTSADLLGTRGTSSNDQGYFRIQSLPTGLYHLHISVISYSTEDLNNVRVGLGTTTNVGTIKLKEKAVQIGEVVVTSERPQIDQSTTSVGKSFTNRELVDLPLERNYQQISQLAPQASVSYYGDGISFLGATGKENRYYINGTNVTEPEADWYATLLPYNFIKEIKVRSGGYEAEYESSLGGVVEAITQSGSNELRGQAFSFYTNNKFSGEHMALGGPLQRSFSQYDMGIGIGGPIVKDRLWFYLSYNPQFENEEVVINGQGNRNFPTSRQIYAGKLSFLYDERNRFEVSVFGDPSTSHSIPSFLSASATFLTEDVYKTELFQGSTHVTVSGTHILSDHLMLESYFSWGRWERTYTPPQDHLGQPLFWDQSNDIISGGNVDSVNESNNRDIKGCLKATWLEGSHVFKAGLEYNYRDNLDIINETVVFRYSDTDYIKGILVENGKVSQRLPTAFVSDSWSITSQWRLNVGVRWEPVFMYASNGKLAQKILDQVAPRVGIIYSPDASGSQKISLSAGRFYQTYGLMLGRWYHTGQTINGLYSYDHDPRVDPTGGNGWTINGGILPEVHGLKGQYEDEMTLGYECQLPWDLKSSARLSYRTLGMGLEDGFDPSGNVLYGNPGYGAMQAWPKMKRTYAGLELVVERSFTKGLSFQASYTLSRLSGNYPGLYDLTGNYGPENSQFDTPQQLTNGDGLLPYDRTHILKLFGLYRFDFGFSAGFSFVWESGTPLSVYGGPVPGYPADNMFIGQRGTAGRTPSIWDASLRFVFDVGNLLGLPLQARMIGDVFHFASAKRPVVFDQIKYFSLDENGNQADPNPDYGKPKVYQSPMSVRIGLEENF
jgi:hypothetical protein